MARPRFRNKNKLLSFTGKVGDLSLDRLMVVDESTSLSKASRLFLNPSVNYLAVERNGVPVGVVTRDEMLSLDGIRNKKDLRVADIMDTQPITVCGDEGVFDTLMYMMVHNLEYLLVVDDNERPFGVVTREDWITAQTNYPVLLIRNIEKATSADRLATLRVEANKLIVDNFTTEGNAVSLAEITTVINDAFVKRIIQIALEEMQKGGLGLPPVPFAWIGMGSEGRKAQTVRTDQDNGIIYDIPPKGQENEVKKWFLQFSEKVVEGLEKCGFPKCPGNIMASNPELCNSLPDWKRLFEKIITKSDSKTLLEASIYFDFRCVYGNEKLSAELWDFLLKEIKEQVFFLRFFAENMLQASRPPIKKWQWRILKWIKVKIPPLDIKREAIAPLDAAVRLLALKYGISETNTLKRLNGIMEKGGISKVMADDVHVAFDFLLRLRFRLEFKYDTEAKTEHIIDPNKLMLMELRNLKDALQTVYEIQNYAFRQAAGFKVPWGMR